MKVFRFRITIKDRFDGKILVWAKKFFLVKIESEKDWKNGKNVKYYDYKSVVVGRLAKGMRIRQASMFLIWKLLLCLTKSTLFPIFFEISLFSNSFHQKSIYSYFKIKLCHIFMLNNCNWKDFSTHSTDKHKLLVSDIIFYDLFNNDLFYFLGNLQLFLEKK